MTDMTVGGTTPSIPPPQPREPKKRNWPDYNKAKMREARDLRELLQKAVRTIPEELHFRQPTGRPSINVEEGAIACVLKVYHLWGGRRSTYFFDDAADRHFLSRS